MNSLGAGLAALASVCLCLAIDGECSCRLRPLCAFGPVACVPALVSGKIVQKTQPCEELVRFRHLHAQPPSALPHDNSLPSSALLD